MGMGAPPGPQQHLPPTFTDGVTLSVLLRGSGVKARGVCPVWSAAAPTNSRYLPTYQLIPSSVAEHQPFPARGTPGGLSLGPAVLSLGLQRWSQ